MTFDDTELTLSVTAEVELAEEPNMVMPVESLLIADVGNTTTTVALFDVVVGSYRLIAQASTPTTKETPWFDASVGVQQAIKHISEMTGRPLLSENNNIIKPSRKHGAGVDHFSAVISASPPLKTVIVGLFEDVSLASARRVLNQTYTRELDVLHLADPRNENQQVQAIMEHQPDLIFIAGGTDGGAERRLLKLVETVSLATGALRTMKEPRVIFAGNKLLREQVRALLGQQVNLVVAENVRPQLNVEQLEDAAQAVNSLYEELRMNTLTGAGRLREWCSFPPQPTALAFTTITQYFAHLQNEKVTGIDIGSNTVTLVMAEGSQTELSIRTDLGLGRPLSQLLDIVPVEAIACWYPDPVEPEEIQNFVSNKALYPQTLPLTKEDLYLEQAVARALIRTIIAEPGAKWVDSQQAFPSFNLLLARGNILANAPRPGQAVLLLLDALQPTGIFSIALDKYGILPQLGILSTHNPLAAVQTLESGVLVNLAWVVAPLGQGQDGQKVLHLQMKTESGKQLELEVEFGTIEVLPLSQGEAAEITLSPEKRFDIGFGPGKGKKITIHGSLVGLVIDARGRPISLSQDEKQRQQKIRKWLWDVGG